MLASIQAFERVEISSRIALSVTTVKCQGCSFIALGAQLAAETSWRKDAWETGWLVKSRTVRRSLIACTTFMSSRVCCGFQSMMPSPGRRRTEQARRPQGRGKKSLEQTWNPPLLSSGSGRRVFERCLVENADMPSTGKCDGPVTLELRHAAGNGLDGEAQIIRNILPRHRQVHGVVSGGFPHPVQQKGGNLLGGPTPAQQKGVALRLRQALQCILEQLLADRVSGAGLLFDSAAPVGIQAAIRHRFGGHHSLVAQLKAEHFAPDMKGFNLAAAVRQEPAYPHPAGQDLVECLCFLALSAALPPLQHFDNRAGGLQGLVQFAEPGGASRQGLCRVKIGCRGLLRSHRCLRGLCERIGTLAGRAKKLG